VAAVDGGNAIGELSRCESDEKIILAIFNFSRFWLSRMKRELIGNVMIMTADYIFLFAAK
jgi:hypothetical protein